jgi:hypothetical protein
VMLMFVELESPPASGVPPISTPLLFSLPTAAPPSAGVALWLDTGAAAAPPLPPEPTAPALDIVLVPLELKI